MNVYERLFSKAAVGADDECWPWRGKTKDGYGMFWMDGRRVRAHVTVWEWMHPGEERAGLSVMHTCNNKRCVNPRHLVLGTHLQNMRDAARDGLLPQTHKTHCPNGHEYDYVHTDPGGQVRRHCIVCRREAVRRYDARKRGRMR